MIEGLAARQAAAALIGAVVDHRQSLDLLIEAASAPPVFRALQARDKSLALAITKAALRHRGTIAALLATLIERPLPDTANSAMHILHAAVAQIILLRVPESAAVNLAVEAAHHDPQAKRFAPLINAVLRRVVAGGIAAFNAAADTSLNAPIWLAEALIADYGADQARLVLSAHAHEAPLDLTVKAHAGHWAKMLGGIVLPTGTVRIAHGTGSALAAGEGIEPNLDEVQAVLPVTELAGFADGAWWVQDAASALPVQLLGNVEGLNIADICAAPGGKTAQLAHGGAHVTALDISASRLKRLEQNLERLGLKAKIIAKDARLYPDVAWTKRATDIQTLARIQFDLIEAAARMLRHGGVIVYANCSLLKDEGERVATRFLAANPEFVLEPVTPLKDGAHLAAFADAQGCLRTTPAMMMHPSGDHRLSGMDGFFAARFRHRG
jgi:16S rRNA (cytosine967-C5)-methyltransferase